MSNNHPPQPGPAPHASRTHVAADLVDTGITTAVRACLNAHPTWRRTRRTYPDAKPGPLAIRPELRRALTDARTGKVDVVLVDSDSQVPRSVDELAEILTASDDAGVSLRSATGPHVTAAIATGRVVMRLAPLFAQFEQEHRERVRRAVR